MNKCIIIQSHLKVKNVVDGDGFFVENTLTKEEFEIRLLGIDAPEIKRCKKLIQDERETHVPGALLMQLGYMSFEFMRELIPPGTPITLIQEKKQQLDYYNRVLGYAYLQDGRSVNEIMVKEGYAKPLSKYPCEELSNYKALHFEAKKQKLGIFKKVDNF